MAYRRKHLFSLFTSDTDNQSGSLSMWVRNLSLMLVTGYGEYPLRIVGFSAGLILEFGVIFRTLLTPSPTESTLFSVQSFITFLIGPTPQTTRTVTIVSTTEGFLGAFFVALFVYAFTRRLNR